MSTQAWDLLVRRLERKAKAGPQAYRLRVAALAVLGYAYMVAILVGVVGGIAAAGWLAATGHPVAVKALIPLGALALVMLRALPVKLDAPEGIELTRSDVPELFALVEDVRRATGAPGIHCVLLDGELNAAVARVPRFGWFGRSRNYLVLGVPLLAVLSREEFRAVLAHELGHVSARHGRFSAWIYRIRQTWERLLATLEEQGHWGVGLFRRFFRWYAPYFAAYSFVLAREHEYEADRVAAAVSGRGVAASALARLEVYGRHLAESYWPSVYAQARTTEQPTCRPFAALAEGLPAGPEADHVQRFVRAALADETGTADTHPSLSDRLTALGIDPFGALEHAAAPVGTSAASLLGPSCEGLVARLDDEWQRGVAAWWEAEHQDSNAAAVRLDELEDRARLGALASDELLELAGLVDRFRGSEEALPLYRVLLERDSANAVANFVVGRECLAAGDDTGLRHLQSSMAADPEAILPACDLAIAFLTEHGRTDEAETFRERASARLDALGQAYEERRQLRLDTEVREHDLPPEIVVGLANQLGRYPQIRRAYLARRVHSHLDDEFPVYVLGVELHIPRWKPHLSDPRPALIQRLASEVETQCEIFFVDLKEARALKKRMRKIVGAQVYARG